MNISNISHILTESKSTNRLKVQYHIGQRPLLNFEVIKPVRNSKNPNAKINKTKVKQSVKAVKSSRVPKPVSIEPKPQMELASKPTSIS